MHESGVLPPGSLQLICGSVSNLLDQLGGQNVICFTGSIETSGRHPRAADGETEVAGRKPEYGEVRWDVEVVNQNNEPVARYDLLTMSARAA